MPPGRLGDAFQPGGLLTPPGQQAGEIRDRGSVRAVLRGFTDDIDDLIVGVESFVGRGRIGAGAVCQVSGEDLEGRRRFATLDHQIAKVLREERAGAHGENQIGANALECATNDLELARSQRAHPRLGRVLEQQCRLVRQVGRVESA